MQQNYTNEQNIKFVEHVLPLLEKRKPISMDDQIIKDRLSNINNFVELQGIISGTTLTNDLKERLKTLKKLKKFKDLPIGIFAKGSQLLVDEGIATPRAAKKLHHIALGYKTTDDINTHENAVAYILSRTTQLSMKDQKTKRAIEVLEHGTLSEEHKSQLNFPLMMIAFGNRTKASVADDDFIIRLAMITGMDKTTRFIQDLIIQKEDALKNTKPEEEQKNDQEQKPKKQSFFGKIKKGFADIFGKTSEGEKSEGGNKYQSLPQQPQPKKEDVQPKKESTEKPHSPRTKDNISRLARHFQYTEKLSTQDNPEIWNVINNLKPGIVSDLIQMRKPAVSPDAKTALSKKGIQY